MNAIYVERLITQHMKPVLDICRHNERDSWDKTDDTCVLFGPSLRFPRTNHQHLQVGMRVQPRSVAGWRALETDQKRGRFASTTNQRLMNGAAARGFVHYVSMQYEGHDVVLLGNVRGANDGSVIIVLPA